MIQNLFRASLLLDSSPLLDCLSLSDTAMHEAAPFTQPNLHSHDLAAKIDFVVGRPWDKTSLLTGYSVRDVLFRPLVREYLTTRTYVCLQRKFGDNVKASIFGEYMRSWRVQDN